MLLTSCESKQGCLWTSFACNITYGKHVSYGFCHCDSEMPFWSTYYNCINFKNKTTSMP